MDSGTMRNTTQGSQTQRDSEMPTRWGCSTHVSSKRSPQKETPNKCAPGKGWIPSLLRAGRDRPALPEHKRSTTYVAILSSEDGRDCGERNVRGGGLGAVGPCGR